MKNNLVELYQKSVIELHFNFDKKKSKEYYDLYKSLGGRKVWDDVALTTQKWLLKLYRKYRVKRSY